MKTTLALVSLVLSLSAFAQEKIELNAEKISVDAESALVVRTNKTPGTVEITFKVPMAKSICERYETRQVLRASGSYCGYDIHERRVPTGQVCTRKNPHNDECLRFEPTYRIETVRSERTCLVPETYCAQYGTANIFETDAMKIQFKNLPALGDSESETFSISSKQRAYDSGKVLYEVKAVETLRDYKISQKKILFIKLDTYVVEEK
jgi:hypothetical protein